MLTDYHSHFLPGVDDGPEDIQTSIEMLLMWKGQGVDRVIATPHFYPHRETLDEFLFRRGKAFIQLIVLKGMPHIELGAEVRVEKGISGIDRLDELALARRGKHILLELPYTPYREWMLTEISDLAHNYSIIPVIAHIERYLKWYYNDDMRRILSLQAVFQINSEALFNIRQQTFALELIRGGLPIILGSNAHNASERAPNLGDAINLLQTKLKKAELISLTALNEALG